MGSWNKVPRTTSPIQEFGKGRVIFHLRTLFPNTGMLLSPCKSVQSMCSTNTKMNIQELDSYLKPFNALTPAMASIKTDNGSEGMRNNFEATATHLLPYDPVVKKRSSGYKRSSTQISSLMEVSDEEGPGAHDCQFQ